jgi:hypothetical protein
VLHNFQEIVTRYTSFWGFLSRNWNMLILKAFKLPSSTLRCYTYLKVTVHIQCHCPLGVIKRKCPYLPSVWCTCKLWHTAYFGFLFSYFNESFSSLCDEQSPPPPLSCICVWVCVHFVICVTEAQCYTIGVVVTKRTEHVGLTGVCWLIQLIQRCVLNIKIWIMSSGKKLFRSTKDGFSEHWGIAWFMRVTYCYGNALCRVTMGWQCS